MIMPDFLKAQALKIGVPEDDVDELWDSHVTYCRGLGKDAGGRMWLVLCEKAVERGPSVKTVPLSDPSIARARRLEREAKLLEDLEYAKHALGLGAWIGDLMAADDFFEPLLPAEHAVIDAPTPGPGAEPLAWLLRHVHVPTQGRAHPCATSGCSGQAASWVREGRRYHGSVCELCVARAKSQAAAE